MPSLFFYHTFNIDEISLYNLRSINGSQRTNSLTRTDHKVNHSDSTQTSIGKHTILIGPQNKLFILHYKFVAGKW